jgi:hypothetical protein
MEALPVPERAMRLRFCTSRWSCLLAFVAAAGITSASSAAGPAALEQNKKPSISVRAVPPVGFSPLRVVVTAELKGGANDFEDFYCATVEWDWGDDTKSENKADCDPYEAGKSEIKRRYVMDHTYRSAAPDLSAQPAQAVQYRIKFLLKQKNKVVGSGSTTVELRQGIGG